MPFVINSSLKFKIIILWFRAFQILNLDADLKTKIDCILMRALSLLLTRICFPLPYLLFFLSA